VQFDTLVAAWHVADSNEARVTAALALTVGEQFHSMLCLIDNNCETHSAAPIRSMLEGVADIILLTRDPRYLEQLRFDNAKADNSTIANYRDSIAADIPAEMASEIASVLKYASATRDSLKEEGFKRQTREEKFQLTQNEYLYAAYGVMCAFVHPNLTSLSSRHMHNVEGVYKLVYRAPPNAKVVSMLLSIGIYVLTRLIELTCHFTDLAAENVQAIAKNIDDRHDIAVAN
jgi:hypothetical protein